ncbi:hypothetical protein CAPTEDRAFT_201913 [Capitella teleta]|uniref:G-protein coupled receptors family 1 profile domain-containing protein n=1 Tax=Capitella teleta TaxID=283909 RepID=R7TCY8_CAPTE|nr:hypothetical protein CAPTEDRAFT_201913 [Capitella teleta]|eukprot:ELT91337.1 hypothetical protein CAPTEDRAFT_201913 [Capitella teleta]
MENVTDVMMTTEPSSSRSWENEPWLHLLRQVCDVGLAIPISVLGIVANVLAFIVLCRQKQQLTTTTILKALSVVDALILLLSFIRPLKYLNLSFYNWLFVSLYPLVYFLRLSGTWLTVLLTVDRFIAVRYPLHASRLCHKKKTRLLITLTLVAAFLFSLVRFFEFKITSENSHGYALTQLTRNKNYVIVYRILLFFIFMYLAPMILLVTLNACLVLALRKAMAHQAGMTNQIRRSRGSKGGSTGGSTPSISSRQVNRSITTMVVGVVLVSILSNVAAMLSHIFWSLPECFDDMDYLELPRRITSNISNVLVSINSAVNFVIYCMCSKNFRVVFLRTFSCGSEQGLNCVPIISNNFDWSPTINRTLCAAIALPTNCTSVH